MLARIAVRTQSLTFPAFRRETAFYGTEAHTLTASQIRADKVYQN
jgi:hypothetical protein